MRDTAGPMGCLPPQPTSFVGRAEEVAALAQPLADPNCRLVTLVGPGGAGKTRLALAVAGSLQGRFVDGSPSSPSRR